nr:MAG TPA: hypothetical protein [Caudoviricetes sp.]
MDTPNTIGHTLVHTYKVLVLLALWATVTSVSNYL